MATVNERLLDAAIDHAVDLQQLSNGEARKIIALLNRADADLRQRLVAAVERMGIDRFTVTHMNSVLESVRELNKAIYAEIGEEAVRVVDELAAYELGYQQTLFTEMQRRGVISDEYDWQEELERIASQGPALGGL